MIRKIFTWIDSVLFAFLFPTSYSESYESVSLGSFVSMFSPHARCYSIFLFISKLGQDIITPEKSKDMTQTWNSVDLGRADMQKVPSGRSNIPNFVKRVESMKGGPRDLIRSGKSKALG